MFQKIIIVGNLGGDPQMRYTPSGQAVTNFNVATNRRYTSSNGERVDETVWFRVSAWGRLAETCNEYLRKGRKVLVEGRLTADPETGGPRVWEGDTGPRASFEISALNVQFLSGRDDDMMMDDGGDDRRRDARATRGRQPSRDDEIPF
jgi:single-strand DNA-binding protein